jgi:transposase
MTTSSAWIGVDVSKKFLDVASTTRALARVANDADGRLALALRLKAEGVSGVIVEATGGIERALVAALTAEHVPASIVNPARVRKFAEGTGQLAKTDRLDAQMLARYGTYMQPAPTVLADEHRQNLRELLIYRAQIVQEITARSAQVKGYLSPDLKARAQTTIEALRAESKALEREMVALMRSREDMRPLYKRLTTMPGVGPIVAATMIAEMPELGRLSRAKIAALAGVAPFPKDTAERRGYRAIRGGRQDVRLALYNAARVAIQHNPPAKVLYERLRTHGKPHKVAVVAVMRKLLTILNAMLKTQTDWIGKTA